MSTDSIDRYFRLAAEANLDRYFAQFTDDAVVEDEGKEYHGIDAVRGWRTSVPPVRYAVREVDSGDSQATVRAEISGDFLGSPVMLGFAFTFAADGRIRALTIRP